MACWHDSIYSQLFSDDMNNHCTLDPSCYKGLHLSSIILGTYLSFQTSASAFWNGDTQLQWHSEISTNIHDQPTAIVYHERDVFIIYVLSQSIICCP